MHAMERLIIVSDISTGARNNPHKKDRLHPKQPYFPGYDAPSN